MSDPVPRPMERDAVCGECGAGFIQIAIPAPLAAAAHARHAIANLDAAIPGGWTPTRCPTCERRALAR